MSGFLSKLTGSNNPEEFKNEENFESNIDYGMEDMLDSSDQISLPIDAYQDEEFLYIRAFMPSVDPKEIDIDITRDTVTISGERFDSTRKDTEDFFQKELSWGKFEKKILLPREIDIESVKASVNMGTLTLKLAKTDKDRKIKVNIG